MADGSRYCCNKVQYHDKAQYFLAPVGKNGEPDFGEDQQNDPSNESSSNPNPLDALVSKGEPKPSCDVPAVASTDFRGIPASVREKYGVQHEFSEADASVAKVFYPMYVKGKQVAWKVRTVDGKKFTIMEVH